MIMFNQRTHPIMNEEGNMWLICNGRIYNDRSLRDHLQAQGHQFRTNRDVEVILHLYEEYGTECVHHLRGMFAFSIWDECRNTFFAARDHFGIKPLYYTHESGRLICSGELKHILSMRQNSPELDRQSLLYYLTLQYVPEPRTMVKGVSKLPPAHYILVEDGKTRVERYWRPEFQPIDQPVEQVRNDIRNVLHDSVQRHMQSDVPGGCFLSSGIDSTAIAALMRQEEKIHTFSVGFEGSNNECPISRTTASVLETNHHERMITEQEYFDVLEKSIWYQEEPVADPSAIALYLVSEVASTYTAAVLSGEGADELFGGYRIYQEPLALSYLRWLPPSMKDSLHSFIQSFPEFYGKNYLLRATTALEHRFVGNAKIFTDDMYQVLAEEIRWQCVSKQTAFGLAQNYYDHIPEADDVTKMQYIDLNLWLPGNILAKADKMTMAHSLELRVPFLDREVFEVARQIPSYFSVDRKTTKRVLREAVAEIVPAHVLNRPKLGFPVPLRRWLRGKRGEECLAFIRSSGICRMVNAEYVTQLVRSHQSGKKDYSRKIWNLYVLAQWYTTFVENFK